MNLRPSGLNRVPGLHRETLTQKKFKKSAHNTEGKDNQKDTTPKFRAMGAKIREVVFLFFSPQF